jgi:hypothetical protein
MQLRFLTQELETISKQTVDRSGREVGERRRANDKRTAQLVEL